MDEGKGGHSTSTSSKGPRRTTHEVQDDVEDNDGDELERYVHERLSESVGARAQLGKVALPDNNGTLRVR